MTAPSTPAFPSIEGPGMTLRQWYAGQALAGLCANAPFLKSASEISNDTEDFCESLAMASCDFADAMLAALKENGDA